MTTCIRVVCTARHAAGIRHDLRGRRETRRDARECVEKSGFSLILSRLVRVSFAPFLPLSLSLRLRVAFTRTRAPTRARSRCESCPTYGDRRLFTSADEVQGLLDQDFSCFTAEYAVIGFCGDTPTRRRRRRRRESRGPVSISVDLRSKRRL